MRLNLPSAGLAEKLISFLIGRRSLGAPGSKTEPRQVPHKPGTREQGLGSASFSAEATILPTYGPRILIYCAFFPPSLFLYNEAPPCPPKNILSFQHLSSHVQLETPYAKVILLACAPKGTPPHTPPCTWSST